MENETVHYSKDGNRADKAACGLFIFARTVLSSNIDDVTCLHCLRALAKK